MSTDPIISFTSDFGSREYYVGAVKGAILSVAPSARLVDISHEIGSHDLLEGAFTLFGAYSTFPMRTIHLVVVDPGVGSSRRALIVSSSNYYFVAPDNGVLSLIYSREEITRVISIEAGHYFREPVSPTFHARDIFGPVAAWIARGIDIGKFGPEVSDYVRLALPPPQAAGDKRLEGIILHIDKFGNAITNLSPENIQAAAGKDGPPTRIVIDQAEIKHHYDYYCEAPGDELFSLVGSSGFYEIAALKKSAARLLNTKRGAKVILEW
ncbi:MAG: SAM hydrolase/SAM-dependent halogenase family protein [Acidobacteriota bacterium]